MLKLCWLESKTNSLVDNFFYFNKENNFGFILLRSKFISFNTLS